jgi:hypothetical protein
MLQPATSVSLCNKFLHHPMSELVSDYITLGHTTTLSFHRTSLIVKASHCYLAFLLYPPFLILWKRALKSTTSSIQKLPHTKKNPHPISTAKGVASKTTARISTRTPHRSLSNALFTQFQIPYFPRSVSQSTTHPICTRNT